MKLSTIAFVVTALTASAAAEPKLAGNVLVWVDAPLYLDAATTASSIHFGALDHGRDKDVGYVVPMHVVGVQGDLVEVEPAAEIECTWWRVVRPEALASLHLYVKRTDLAPVVVKAFTVGFKDGSRVSLQPGVAVVGGKVAFDEASVPVAVPEANLGVAYAPHSIAAVPNKPTNHTVLLDEHTDVTLGDQTFAFGPWVASTAERRGAHMLFPIAARCMTALLSVPKDHVHTDVSFGAAYGAGPLSKGAVKVSTADRYYFKKGTKLTSETGDHVVATLAMELDVKKPAAARACGDFVVTRDELVMDAPHIPDAAQPDRTLHLCAPADQVIADLHGRF